MRIRPGECPHHVDFITVGNGLKMAHFKRRHGFYSPGVLLGVEFFHGLYAAPAEQIEFAIGRSQGAFVPLNGQVQGFGGMPHLGGGQ